MMLVSPTQEDVLAIFVHVIFQNIFNSIPHTSVWGCRGTNSFWIKSNLLLFLRKTVMMMMTPVFMMAIVTTIQGVVAIYVHVLIRIAPCIVTIQISQIVIVSSIDYYCLHRCCCNHFIKLCFTTILLVHCLS